jgi:hypothetical protein
LYLRLGSWLYRLASFWLQLRNTRDRAMAFNVVAFILFQTSGLDGCYAFHGTGSDPAKQCHSKHPRGPGLLNFSVTTPARIYFDRFTHSF